MNKIDNIKKNEVVNIQYNSPSGIHTLYFLLHSQSFEQIKSRRRQEKIINEREININLFRVQWLLCITNNLIKN